MDAERSIAFEKGREICPSRLLNKILDIGEDMLITGAEINRVEDTVRRICQAYGMSDVHVFTITSSIIVTATAWDGEIITQTRRIFSYSTNFTKLELLNNLSRTICQNLPDIDYIEEQLQVIRQSPLYKQRTYYLAYAMISAVFSIFFGGSLRDAAAAALIGLLLRFIIIWCRRMEMNFIVSNLLCSLAGGVASVMLVRLGLGESMDKIMIGNIMLLIPGISLTNAIRDMISGDIMSGVLRLCEAVLISISLAVGFTLAMFL